MRDVNSFISVGEVLPDFTLKNLRVFEFDAENRMRSAVEARTAHYVVSEQIWELEQVRQSLFQEGNVQARQIREARWASVLAPEILSIFLVRPEQLSAFQLRQYIGHLQDNGQDTDRYELAFWHKLILPLSTGVMILVALPFVFSSLRSSSFGRSLFIGIMLGVGFFLANRSFGYFVQLYGVPPLLGALTPTLVFCAGAILALRRQA
jgi:lipopolysaccharide export system permease protein